MKDLSIYISEKKNTMSIFNGSDTIEFDYDYMIIHEWWVPNDDLSTEDKKTFEKCIQKIADKSVDNTCMHIDIEQSKNGKIVFKVVNNKKKELVETFVEILNEILDELCDNIYSTRGEYVDILEDVENIF